MKNIVFIAPPAAGKGTQSEMLVEKYNYEHISTGDLLREEAKKTSLIAEEIKSYQKDGILVPDEIVIKLLSNKLESISDKPFILDGYPRNISQVEKLKEILENVNKTLDQVIYLDVPFDLLLKRTVGRLVCTECGFSYNEYFLETKPKKDFICDNCGNTLVRRSDDTEETFKIRYEEFLKNTKPVIDYYKDNGMLCIIDKVDTPLETFKEIESVIKW